MQYFFQVALKEVLDESTKYGLFDEDEDDEDDPDALTDPLYNVSLKKYLSQFVTEFAGQPFFQVRISYASHTLSLLLNTLSPHYKGLVKLLAKIRVSDNT